MIKFVCKCDFDINVNEVSKMNYSELLKSEVYFCIIINKKIFFEEPLFPIYEFVYSYINWNKSSDFHYVTLESDDNPLISFVNHNGDYWSIESPWQKFNCQKEFNIDDFINAMELILR